MELRILKNKEHIIGYLLSGITLISMLALINLFFIKELFLLFIIIIIICIYLLSFIVFRSKIFIHISFNDMEIRVDWNKKILKVLLWEDVLEIKGTQHLRTRSVEFLTREEERIVFNANNKIISKLISICPVLELKEKLKKIKFII